MRSLLRALLNSAGIREVTEANNGSDPGVKNFAVSNIRGVPVGYSRVTGHCTGASAS